MSQLEEHARHVVELDEYTQVGQQAIKMAYLIASYYKNLVAAGMDKETAVYLTERAQSEFWENLEI